MSLENRRSASVAMLAAPFAIVLVSSMAAAWQAATPQIPRTFVGPRTTVLTPESVSRLLREPEEATRGAWRPEVNTERARGDVAALYARMAPAVVAIRTLAGHGTGFLVDAQGTVITNHHVAAAAAMHDPVRRASYVMAHLGTLQADGTMSVQREARRAYIHKLDAGMDLAVLKLSGLPPGTKLPFLTLADAAPKPGAPAVALGHPAAGLLWTIRTGEVTSIGRLPADLANVVMFRLSAAAARRDQIVAELERLPSRRIVQTSIGINPGDSGGPVTDPQGRVIAVTFAVPRNPALAKFSYHVHLDELKTFLKAVPPNPILVTPDPWDMGSDVAIVDLNGDNRPDLLVAGEEDNVDTLLVDVDNDTPVALLRDADALVSKKRWEFEAAVKPEGDGATGFYDSDNDGTIDLILSASGNTATNTRFTRTPAGQWQIDVGKPFDPISGAHFRTPAMGKRFEALVTEFIRRAEGARR